MTGAKVTATACTKATAAPTAERAGAAWAWRALLAAVLVASSGCAAIVSRTSGRLADGLTVAVLDQTDPETVRQGAPAYLVLIDGLIADSPESVALLRTGAELYAAYTAAFVTDPVRAKRLAERARSYGLGALCAAERATCGLEELSYEKFEGIVERVGVDTVPELFAAAAAWGTWIRANKDDWSAIADKARVEAMMNRVAALDDGYRNGAAHTYLGILAIVVPPALGGRPEDARAQFEKAFELSGGRDLATRLLVASDYARAVWDRELHDRICREVLAADPIAPRLTLMNTLAQEEAARLLASADDYFGE